MNRLILFKYRAMDKIRSFNSNNKGMGTVEIILIIVEIYINYLYVFNVYIKK